MPDDTFGDRLRTEREDRGLTIQAVAEMLEIDPGVLRALERNDFGALPDEDVMDACLHGYAECLRVEAELMIEDYEQERDEFLRRLETAGSVQAADTGSAPGRAAAVSGTPTPRWLVALAVVAVALVAWWALSKSGSTAPETPLTAPSEPVPVASLPSESETPAPDSAEPPVEEPSVGGAQRATAEPDYLQSNFINGIKRLPCSW